MHERYLTFSGDHYYPQGGWDDLVGSSETLADAILMGEREEWWHVIDSRTLEVVALGGDE